LANPDIFPAIEAIKDIELITPASVFIVMSAKPVPDTTIRKRAPKIPATPKTGQIPAPDRGRGEAFRRNEIKRDEFQIVNDKISV